MKSNVCTNLFFIFFLFLSGLHPAFSSPSVGYQVLEERPPEGLSVSNTAFNVKDYGAVGDGSAVETVAINKAIEVAADAGGGTVYFPAGKYLSGSIRLQSHVRLYLDRGVQLIASQRAKDYDKPEPLPFKAYQDFGHSHWKNALIWGIDLEDIGIEGPGLLTGEAMVTGTPKGSTLGMGDKVISLKNCRNVTLRDFSILKGGHFGILATGVDNLTIDNVTMDTNRDGMNIDACKNVMISNCRINSPWNDAICLKSSFALGYARPTENVTITNCLVSGGYKIGSFLDGTFEPLGDVKTRGRIKLGTESNGGFKNITISNCVFDHGRGLALEAVDGGDLEDIAVSNITMRNITNDALFIRLGSRLRGPKGTKVGNLRRINISDMVIYRAGGEAGSVISGIPGHDVEDVNISNVRIIFKGGGTQKDAATYPPEKEDAYPGHDMFGILPSYAFFIRHVKGLTFDNIKLSYEGTEERPPLILDDVKDSEFRFVQAEHEKGKPFMILKRSQNIRLLESGTISDRLINNAKERSF